MKKILLLFCFVLLMTGCSTEVTLKIDEEKVSETIKIFGLKSEIYSNNVLNEDVKFYVEIFEREYEFYDIKEFEDQNYIGKIYELSEKPELWAELSHLRPCYETFKLTKTDTNISLYTSEEYRCGYLYGANDVTLTIESDLELISTNADKVEGNKLIWNINTDNYKNKSISFDYEITNSKDSEINSQYLKYIFLVIFVLVIGIFFFIKKRNKDNNKI